jgi:hypothetical protein
MREAPRFGYNGHCRLQVRQQSYDRPVPPSSVPRQEQERLPWMIMKRSEITGQPVFLAT